MVTDLILIVQHSASLPYMHTDHEKGEWGSDKYYKEQTYRLTCWNALQNSDCEA